MVFTALNSIIAHDRVKSKITKILNSEKNSKRKVPNQHDQIAKSKAQTHASNEWITTVIFRNWYRHFLM